MSTILGVIGTTVSGDNSADVTLTAVGSTPSADGASISGQALTLQPANATHPGVVTTGAQTFAGAKTFTSDIVQATDGVGLGLGGQASSSQGIFGSGTAVAIRGSTLYLQSVAGAPFATLAAGGITQLGGGSGPSILAGANTPEGAATAPVGSLFLRTNGGAGTTLYVKESGSGNTGWAAK